MTRRPIPGPVVGLTGGMGAGKSLALSMLGRMPGVGTLSADEVAHELLRRPSVKRRLVRAFGPRVLSRGAVDRRILARFAFATRSGAARLGRILHPMIRRELVRRIRARRGRDRLTVVEVPLLFEARFEGLFDGVLSISAPRALRGRRIGRDRIRQRDRHQWGRRRRDARADWVVRNVSTRRALASALRRWAQERMERQP